MFSRLTWTISLLAIALAVAIRAQPAAASKTGAAKAIARTKDGHPDMQGNWVNKFATPLERPKELEGRPTLTDEEVVELNKRARKIFENGTSDAAAADAFFLAALRNEKEFKSGGATDSAERVLELIIDNRTSLITDPPDGKLPAYTEAGQKRRAAYGRARSGTSHPSGPKEVAPGDRCITFGVPRVNGVYAAGMYGYYQIVQAHDEVLFFTESIHDTRIFPTDGRPHLPPDIRNWSGDSRAHWQGDTLVVDTTNFKSELDSFGVSKNFHLIERLTLVSPDELRYEMTFDDPDTWVRPWTAMIRLLKTDEQLHEFACHEGNEVIMQTILSGAGSRER